MDVKIKVQGEVELPGGAVLELLRGLVEGSITDGLNGMAILSASTVLIFQNEDNVKMAVVPACDCDNCTYFREGFKRIYRSESDENLESTLNAFKESLRDLGGCAGGKNE